MASLLNTIRSRFYYPDGRPLSGGRVHTYEAGTLVPKATFSDAALTIQNANPVILDSAGGADIFISGNYKVRTFDAAGILIESLDNVSDYPAGVDAENVRAIAPFTGAQQRTQRDKNAESVSVKDFGAVGDGVAHPLSEYYATLSAAQTAYAGVGITSLTQTIDWAATQAANNYAASVGRRFSLVGLNLILNNKLACTASIVGDGGKITGYIEITAGGVELSDFWLLSTQALYGIYSKGASASVKISDVTLKNVRISFDPTTTTAFRLGLYAQYTDRFRVLNCRIDYGIYMIRCFDYLINGNYIDGDNFQNENELIHCSVRSYGIISNNTLTNSKDNFIDLYPSGERTVVTGNRMIGCKVKTGAAIEIKVTLTDDDNNTSGGANDYGFTEQIIIANNYIGGIIAPSSIFVTFISIFHLDSRASPVFSWANVPRNIIIANNILDGFDNTLHASSHFAAIYLKQVNAVSVFGNIMRNMGIGGLSSDASTGVWVESSRDVQIKHNRIALKDACAVTFHGDCDQISTSSNHFGADLNAEYTLSYGVRIQKTGSFATPVLTDCIFDGNFIDASVSSFRQFLTAGSSLTGCQISNNMMRNECVAQSINRSKVVGNQFEVSATRNAAMQLGEISSICAHNVVSNNSAKTPVGTPKNAFLFYRMRASIVTGNISSTASYGLQFVGTSTANELDNLIVKDNISVSQSQAAFPIYSSMAAGDTATLIADTNIKTV